MQTIDPNELVFSSENNIEFDSIITILDIIVEFKKKLLYTNKKSISEFDELMTNLFPLFKEKYESLYKMVLSNKDITMAYDMINHMKNINNGSENINDVRNYLGKKLDKQYVEPVVGKLSKK